MKKNLLSVIIPTFHRELEFIIRAVNSVKKQSYPDIEILIIDDNENSNSLSIEIKNYCNENNLIYIKQFGNSGACNARNLGAINSSGEYIAFLDDDDEWFPTKALEQISVLKKGYGLVFSKGLNVYCETEYKEQSYGNNKNFLSTPSFNDLLIKNYIGTTSQIIIKREYFLQVNGFDPNFDARQDYDFYIRVSQKCKIYGMDKILFKHYHHSQYQISKDINKSLQGYRMLYKKYKKYYINNALAYINICCKIAKLYLHKKLYILWFFFVTKAAIKSPSNLKYILKNSCDSKII